jgi:hypothetical protein
MHLTEVVLKDVEESSIGCMCERQEEIGLEISDFSFNSQKGSVLGALADGGWLFTFV